MIEINLLPPDEGSRTSGPGRRSLTRIALPRHLDLWLAGSIAIVLIAVLASLLLLISSSRLTADRSARLQQLLGDSLVVAAGTLEHARAESVRDSLALRILRLENLDRSRYRWPHLLDEISRALPAGVRLSALTEIARPGSTPSGGSGPGYGPEAGTETIAEETTAFRFPIRLRLEGVAMSNSTLTRYWNGLEASAFVRNVQLVHTEAIRDMPGDLPDADSARIRYRFVLEADSEDLPAGAGHEFTAPGQEG